MFNFLKYISIFILLLSLASCTAELNRKDKVSAIIGDLESPFFIGAFTPNNLIEKSGVMDGVLPMTYETILSFIFKGEIGVDQNSQIQLAASRSGGLIPKLYGFIPLTDAVKFKKAVEKELNAQVIKRDDVFYFRKDKDNYLVAWKGDLAIVTNIPLKFESMFSKSTLDAKKTAVAVVNMINEIDKENINPNFRSFLDKSGDFTIFLDGKGIYETLNKIKFIPYKNKKEAKLLLDGTIAEAALTFEEGFAILACAYNLSDSLEQYVNFVGDNGVGEDMLSFAKSNNPELVYASVMSTENILKYLENNAEWIDMNKVNSKLLQNDFAYKAIVSAFSGEMVMMLDGMQKLETSYYIDQKERVEISHVPTSGLVFNLLDSNMILNHLNSLDSNSFNGIYTFEDFYLQLKNNKLFISNSKQWSELVLTDQSFIVKDEKKILSNHPIAVIGEPAIKELIDIDYDEIESLLLEITNFEGFANLSIAEFKVFFNEKNINSMRVVLQHFVDEYEAQSSLENSELKAILEEESLESITNEIESDLEDIIEEIEEVDATLKELFK